MGRIFRNAFEQSVQDENLAEALPKKQRSLDYLKVQCMAKAVRLIKGVVDIDGSIQVARRRAKDQSTKTQFLAEIEAIQKKYSKVVAEIYMLGCSPLWALPTTAIGIFLCAALAMEAGRCENDLPELCHEITAIMRICLPQISRDAELDLEISCKLALAFFEAVSLREQEKTQAVADYAARHVLKLDNQDTEGRGRPESESYWTASISKLPYVHVSFDRREAHGNSLPACIMDLAARTKPRIKSGSYSMHLICKLEKFAVSCLLHRDESLKIAALEVEEEEDEEDREQGTFSKSLSDIKLHGYTVDLEQKEAGLRIWSEEMQVYDFWEQVVSVAKLLKVDGEIDAHSFVETYFENFAFLSAITRMDKVITEQEDPLQKYFQESLLALYG